MSALLNHASPVASGAKNRNSLPPSFQSSNLPPLSSAHRAIHTMSYTASPLQKALTPPPYEFERSRENDLEPFPSIESSLMDSTSRPYPAGNAESSPLLPSQARAPHRFSNPTPPTFSRNRDIRIACANCSRVRPIAECYACTECICGVCRECLSLVVGSPSLSMGSPNKTANMGPTSYPSARACPRCRTVGGNGKPFNWISGDHELRFLGSRLDMMALVNVDILSFLLFVFLFSICTMIPRTERALDTC